MCNRQPFYLKMVYDSPVFVFRMHKERKENFIAWVALYNWKIKHIQISNLKSKRCHKKHSSAWKQHLETSSMIRKNSCVWHRKCTVTISCFSLSLRNSVSSSSTKRKSHRCIFGRKYTSQNILIRDLQFNSFWSWKFCILGYSSTRLLSQLWILKHSLLNKKFFYWM